MNHLKSLARKLYAHKKALFFGATGLVAGLITACAAGNLYVYSFKKYILTQNSPTHTYAGIVLGAGVTKDGKPFKELQARLDSAAEALAAGRVQKLLLSGDNRFKYYDEPTAMKNYLIYLKHIDPAKLQVDFAGRSTYESCDRAAHVFDIHDAIVFSANSHLPRAIYLCRSFGITTYGIGNSREANNATRREFLARLKALFNVYIYGEQTILGPKISF